MEWILLEEKTEHWVAIPMEDLKPFSEFKRILYRMMRTGCKESPLKRNRKVGSVVDLIEVADCSTNDPATTIHNGQMTRCDRPFVRIKWKKEVQTGGRHKLNWFWGLNSALPYREDKR